MEIGQNPTMNDLIYDRTNSSQNAEKLSWSSVSDDMDWASQIKSDDDLAKWSRIHMIMMFLDRERLATSPCSPIQAQCLWQKKYHIWLVRGLIFVTDWIVWFCGR